jgi:dihydroorotase/N-acyl-D-amino-acid deacylase
MRTAFLCLVALLTIPGTLSLRSAPQPAAAQSAQSTPYDVILRGGRIVDGTGSPWYRADIALRGDTIALIAPAITAAATRVIEVNGLVVAPGFIDIHTHARRGIFEVPTADNYVRQGVTTVVEGPDGGSPIPLAPFLAKVAATRITPNFASFIGQGSVRAEVIGDVDRPATPAEVEKMRALVRQGMEDGAFGLSSGLFYVPGAFTPTAEVVELAKVAGRLGGIHISHMRDEASKVLDSVNETIAIGEQGGLPTQVTHHKVVGKKYWGKSVDTLRAIDAARARGVDATIDQYPYTASATSIGAALLPTWAQEGGREAVLKRLKNADQRAKIKFETVAIIRDERGGGDPKNVVVSSAQFDPTLAGKNLAQITQGRGLPVTLENAAETALWIVEQGGAQGIFHAINEEDLRRILVHPATMIGSDGEIPVFGRNHPHPRSYGTFARVLGVYVRDHKLLPLEVAVQKMSAFPAQRLGLSDRGVLRQGLKADIAIFDPARVRDTATFEKPHAYAEGVSHVIVNGAVVFENGAMTSARPGRVLYGPAFRGQPGTTSGSAAAAAAAAPVPAPQAPTGASFVSPTGTRLRMLLGTDTFGGTEMEIGEITFAVNSDSGDHAHGAVETFYILEGELEHIVDGKSIKLGPGMVGTVRPPAQVRHKTGPAGARALVIWNPGGEAGRIGSRWKREP